MLSASKSPLTCDKVFQIIPRVNKINTPVINDRISKRFGLPEVSSSAGFKAEYCKRRDELRRVNGKDPNFQGLVQQIKSSTFCIPSEEEPGDLRDSAGRPDASYKAQIQDLQMRLHEATVQIEIANKENVEKNNKLENQARRLFLKDKDLATVKLELQRVRNDREDEEEVDEEIVRQSRGPKRKSWEDLGTRAKKRASDACQREILGTAAVRQTDPMTIASHCLYRNAYQTDKLVAESARKIEAGETVAPRKMVNLDHATWLVTLGEGFGKQQYRS